jgi:MFS family permease
MKRADAIENGSASNVSMTPEQRRIVLGSALGTVFEWYDLLLFASLSPIIAAQFFSKLNPNLAFIFALLTFSTAYVARPVGALIFGPLGDLVGRKYTFLITVAGMGVATFLVGLLPNYSAWGLAAPVCLMALRIVQGLSLGGEFGGASTYVAEHAPPRRLGFFTSWIQGCSAAGFCLSLLVVAATRAITGEAAFAQWGWRIPFLLSIILLVVSAWIRLSLVESPIFQAMKASGLNSKRPIRDAFGNWKNLGSMLVAMFGCVVGVTVVGAMSLLYPLLFLVQTLRFDPLVANLLATAAVLVALPLFPVVGHLSDRIGRKPIIVAGCLVAAVCYFPLVHALTHFANPAFEAAQKSSKVVISADLRDCSFMFNPIGTARFVTPCDIARTALAREGANYVVSAAPADAAPRMTIGDSTIDLFDGRDLDPAAFNSRLAALSTQAKAALRAAGYPEHADLSQANLPVVWLIMMVIAAFMPLAYGASTAVMVELFPARIRYTSLSVPYHFGNIVSGFLIPVVFAMVTATGDIYFGLWYPIVLATLGAAIVAFFIPDTRDRKLDGWY